MWFLNIMGNVKYSTTTTNATTFFLIGRWLTTQFFWLADEVVINSLVKCWQIPELSLEFREAGSLAGVVGPALGHQTVECRRAVGWHGQPLAILDAPYHVIVLHTLEGLDTVHEDLPHAHPYEMKKERERECVREKEKNNNYFWLIWAYFQHHICTYIQNFHVVYSTSYLSLKFFLILCRYVLCQYHWIGAAKYIHMTLIHL